jgi:hypothetical protein
LITQWIINLVLVLLRPIFNLLPHIDLSPIQNAASNGGILAGQYAGKFNGIFPVQEFFNLASWFATYVEPAAIAYLLISWVWRHIPEIGGFGPGAG